MYIYIYTSLSRCRFLWVSPHFHSTFQQKQPADPLPVPAGAPSADPRTSAAGSARLKLPAAALVGSKRSKKTLGKSDFNRTFTGL